MEERAGCFDLFVFQGYRDCCVAVPHDAMGLSSYFLIILTNYFSQKILLFETLLYCLIILLFDHSIDVSHVLVSNLGTLGPSFFFNCIPCT